MPTPALKKVADALLELPWADMTKLAEAVLDEIPHLRKSDKLDRDGIAQSLNDLAGEIISAHQRAESETETSQ